MDCLRVLSVMILSAASLFAQNVIPAGTVLPVRLDTTLDTNKSRVGQVISGTIMQDVPLASGIQLQAGTHVTGHVLELKESNSVSKLVFAFDQIRTKNRDLAVLTNARAMASSVEVRLARLPRTSEDRPEWQWTTVQVGGDVVYGIADRVEAAGKFVGRPVTNGVLVQLSATPGRCGGDSGNDRQQALWVFSSGACGLYGFEKDLAITHAGRANPVGSITLESPRRIHLGKGVGMLLRVDSEAQSSAQASSL